MVVRGQRNVSRPTAHGGPLTLKFNKATRHFLKSTGDISLI